MKDRGIGIKISALRQELGLIQAELGAKLGYSQRAISDWENGNTEPCLSAIKKIYKLFDVSLEELFESVE